QLMVPVFVLVVGLLPARSATWVVAVAGAGYLAVRTAPAAGASGGWHTAVSELSLALVFVALTVVFVPAWRRTAAIADEAARTQQRAFAEAEAARAVDRQERAASRLLHDEVIHALRPWPCPPGRSRNPGSGRWWRTQPTCSAARPSRRPPGATCRASCEPWPTDRGCRSASG
ncbi:MAG TPA: hypothetical protein VIU11_03415, partial [Nakamurella sp.]